MSNENVVLAPEVSEPVNIVPLVPTETLLTPETKEISYPITIKSTIRSETFSYSDMLKKGLKIEPPKIEPKEETKEKPQTLPNRNYNNRRFTRN
jgi:hypothetical protein